jgi:hypothetical protein
MTRQPVSHKMDPCSQQSQRYVEFTEALPAVAPECIETDSSMARFFDQQCSRAFALYREMCQAGIPGHVTEYRDVGVKSFGGKPCGDRLVCFSRSTSSGPEQGRGDARPQGARDHRRT